MKGGRGLLRDKGRGKEKGEGKNEPYANGLLEIHFPKKERLLKREKRLFVKRKNKNGID